MLLVIIAIPMRTEEWIFPGGQPEHRKKILDPLVDYIKQAKTEELF